MRPLLLLILTLVSSLQAVQWPAGTKAVIPFTANRTLVGESVPNFAYQVKIVTDTRFKAAFNSAANITIFDTATGLVRPARIWYYTKDTVYADFDGPTFTSVNKTFYACAGLAINRVNSAQTYTNSNIIIAWRFTEAGGTSAIEFVSGSSGSVAGTGTLGNQSSFGRAYANATDNTDARINGFSGFNFLGDLTIETHLNSTTKDQFGRVFANNRFQLQANRTNYALKSDGSTAAVSGTIPNNEWGVLCATRSTTGIVNFYYNGSQSGTANQSSGTPVGDLSQYFIGNYPSLNRSFNGSIGSILVYSGIQSSGIIQTRSAMLLTPQTFWTQGASFGVGKSTNNNKNNLHIGISLF